MGFDEEASRAGRRGRGGLSTRAGPGRARRSGAARSPQRTAKHTLSLKVAVVDSNRHILATGTAHPVPEVGWVALQSRRGGSWRRLGRHRLDGNGVYAVRAGVPGGVGQERLRTELYQGKVRRAISPVRTLRFKQPTSPSTPNGPGTTTPTSPSSPVAPVTPAGPAEPPCTPAATSAGSPPAASDGPLSAGSLMATIEKLRLASQPPQRHRRIRRGGE